LRTKSDSKELERLSISSKLPSQKFQIEILSLSTCNGKNFYSIYPYRLQDDLKSDRWLTMRPRKLMSNPKRVPWKNYRTLRDDYRRAWLVNFFIGAGLAWPVAVLVGRRATVSQGGVAAVPIQRWIHDWPNVNPMRTTWKYFRRYSALTCMVAGCVVANKFTDDSALYNQYYTRPDLKPKAAMVKESTDYDSVAYQQML
jgi:hypothetical protein